MLEMALALPLLVLIMALMINYGTVAAWKVRDLSVARLAVWESRWPRTGNTDPQPKYWPTTGTSSSTDGPKNVSALDDSRVDLPVARGPMQGATVDSNLLDPTRGLLEGSASLTRRYPLMGKWPEYTLSADNSLLDDKWQYPRTHLSGNVQRRVPVLYQLAKAPASLVNAYVQAVTAIVSAPFTDQLKPLDNDDEFTYYGKMFGWGGPPDFQPRLQNFCSLDKSVADNNVQNLIDRIQGNPQRHIMGIPEIMARAFIALYQRVIQVYKGMLNTQPPPSPGQVAGIQGSIQDLQQKIETLQKFLLQLQGGNGG